MLGSHTRLVPATKNEVAVSRMASAVERHGLNRQGLGRSFDRPRRIELVCADPGNAAQKNDGERGDRPDDEFDAA
jgi:hypothetical protein